MITRLPETLLRSAATCCGAICMALATSAAAYDWLQFNGGPAHSGNNTAETTLSATNVATLGLKFQATLPAASDGTPVFLESVAGGSL